MTTFPPHPGIDAHYPTTTDNATYTPHGLFFSTYTHPHTFIPNIGLHGRNPILS